MMIVIMANVHVDAKEKAHVKKRAKKAGTSMNAIMRDLIQKDMERVKR